MSNPIKIDTPADVVGVASDRGIRLWVEADGTLCYDAPKGALTPPLRKALAHFRPAIVSLLPQNDAPAKPPKQEEHEALKWWKSFIAGEYKTLVEACTESAARSGNPLDLGQIQTVDLRRIPIAVAVDAINNGIKYNLEKVIPTIEEFRETWEAAESWLAIDYEWPF